MESQILAVEEEEYRKRGGITRWNIQNELVNKQTYKYSPPSRSWALAPGLSEVSLQDTKSKVEVRLLIV